MHAVEAHLYYALQEIINYHRNVQSKAELSLQNYAMSSHENVQL